MLAGKIAVVVRKVDLVLHLSSVRIEDGHLMRGGRGSIDDGDESMQQGRVRDLEVLGRLCLKLLKNVDVDADFINVCLGVEARE